MDPDVETLADDGGEADRFEAEAEAELLRDRFRLAVINIATSEGRLKWHHFSTWRPVSAITSFSCN